MSDQNFRTAIKLSEHTVRIDHRQTLLSIGSCFSEHIHGKMKTAGFNTRCNPNGIVYNPISIGVQILSLLGQRVWNEADIIFDQGLYHGLHHHGRFSAPDLATVLASMNDTSSSLSAYLMKVDRLLVTFGSAITYTHVDSGQLVANCHKIPSRQFIRRILTVEEMVISCQLWIEALRLANPDLQIIFTLSPVRYLKEGFTDNTLSKARLYLVIHELCNQYDFIHYFPSYEIMLDDLRDYRFYNQDMVHHNDQAVNYIWQKFSTLYFDKSTLLIKDKIEKLNQARAHKSLHPDTPDHIKFKQKLQQELHLLRQDYPWLE